MQKHRVGTSGEVAEPAAVDGRELVLHPENSGGVVERSRDGDGCPVECLRLPDREADGFLDIFPCSGGAGRNLRQFSEKFSSGEQGGFDERPADVQRENYFSMVLVTLHGVFPRLMMVYSPMEAGTTTISMYFA